MRLPCHLAVQLAALRRDRYGKSSERLAAEIGQLEMLIGDRCGTVVPGWPGRQTGWPMAD
jgi:hypothetical protein